MNLDIKEIHTNVKQYDYWFITLGVLWVNLKPVSQRARRHPPAKKKGVGYSRLIAGGLISKHL